MNINNLTPEDWKSLAAELIWFNVVSHKNEYSGYDIITNADVPWFTEKEGPLSKYPRGNKPGDIHRDIRFLSYYIGPTRQLTWKELALALGLYKDILLPDYHDCSKCEDHKNCRAYFKDDPDQERCSGWMNDHKDELPDLEEEYKKFMDNILK